MRPSALPLLFEMIALAAVAGCASEHEIDRSNFTLDVCNKGVPRPALEGVTPAPGIDALELRSIGFDGEKHVVDSFGTLCAKAKSPSDCNAAADKLQDSQLGWFPFTYDVPMERRYLVASRGDFVEPFYTVASAKKAFGTIDTLAEAAFLAAQDSPHQLQCGASAAKSPDGGFDLLTKTGSGCGENDDVELHVVHVSPAGDVSVTETETLQRSNPNCVIGRRPEGVVDRAVEQADLGAFVAEMERLEAASVVAFARMARELRALGAPEALVVECERASDDEIRHAVTIARLARRFGGEALAPSIEDAPLRSLEALALDNAREGCIRETFGALVATHQVHAARDPEIAAAMRDIARDETRHAQLSWALASWARPLLSPETRALVDAEMAKSLDELRRDLHTPACESAIALAGFPPASVAVAMLDRLAPELVAA
jgi:hypothetical protein